jgi:hypothetical protein
LTYGSNGSHNFCSSYWVNLFCYCFSIVGLILLVQILCDNNQIKLDEHTLYISLYCIYYRSIYGLLLNYLHLVLLSCSKCTIKFCKNINIKIFWVLNVLLNFYGILFYCFTNFLINSIHINSVLIYKYSNLIILLSQLCFQNNTFTSTCSP